MRLRKRRRLALEKALFLSVSIGTSLLMPYVALADFSISGTLPQFEPGSTLELLRQDIDQQSQSLEGEIQVETNGSFHATFDGEPGLFSLILPSHEKIALAIDTDQRIVITSAAESPTGYRIDGSPDTEILQAYETLRKDSLVRLVYPPRAALNEANMSRASTEIMARLAAGEVEGYATHRRELNDFSIDRAKTSIALYATSLRWDGDHRIEALQEQVESFAQTHPDLAITRSMLERLRLFSLTAIQSISSPLSGKDLDGNPLSLESYRGKTVLVDFWASWCIPCRVENRHYSKLLEKYSSLGFEVFGVNLDESRFSWARASKRDGVSWPQISDSLGWNSPLAKAYNVSALPMSFLLDPEGRIIARNLRGEQLAAKLEALLR